MELSLDWNKVRKTFSDSALMLSNVGTLFNKFFLTSSLVFSSAVKSFLVNLLYSVLVWYIRLIRALTILRNVLFWHKIKCTWTNENKHQKEVAFSNRIMKVSMKYWSTKYNAAQIKMPNKHQCWIIFFKIDFFRIVAFVICKS